MLCFTKKEANSLIDVENVDRFATTLRSDYVYTINESTLSQTAPYSR